MTPAELTQILTERFGETAVVLSPEAIQIDTPEFRLLALLSEDQQWLRLLLPIVPLQEAEPYLKQALQANFDETQLVRYAVEQDILWAVYHHHLGRLDPEELAVAIAQLLALQQAGITSLFNHQLETQLRQIIWASKRQGQTLATTLQTLERFYAEGMMGELDQSAESRDRTLAAWRNQLNRLWDTIDPADPTP